MNNELFKVVFHWRRLCISPPEKIDSYVKTQISLNPPAPILGHLHFPESSSCPPSDVMSSCLWSRQQHCFLRLRCWLFPWWFVRACSSFVRRTKPQPSDADSVSSMYPMPEAELQEMAGRVNTSDDDGINKRHFGRENGVKCRGNNEIMIK